MGNKIGSKRKSSSSTSSSDGSKKPEVKRRQKKNGSSVSGETVTSRDKKVISCPDLSGAVPYGYEEGGEGDNTENGDSKKKVSIDVKIYRSFSNVAETGEKQRLNALAGPPPDIRVYRRSTGSLAAAQNPDRSQTLPRSFGRARSAAGTATQHHQQRQSSQQQGQSNGSLPRDRRSDGDGVVRRRSTLGSGYNLGTTRGSRRTLSTASMNSIGYKVNAEDFPDTATIQRRLTQFETTFVRNFVEVFFSADLPDSGLLSLLSIAVRSNRSGGQQPVTLLQYLESVDVPANLHESGGGTLSPEYVLTIPQILFKEVFRIRQEKVRDVKAWTAIGRHIMSCQAMEAANELSRVFEYQLSLMPEGGVAMDLLCRHGAECVRQFLKRTGGHIDRNTIVHGVIGGHLRVPEVCPKFSIIIGERELKWNMFEILKKPGLRKELLLTSANEEMDDERAPWKFFRSSKTDSMLYGYRSLIVDWDFATGSYRLDVDDQASFPDEMDWRPDDFHRDYNPYRRLVGLDAMRAFCSSSADRSTGATLADYVNAVQGRTYARDRIQPVYRPVGDRGPEGLPALDSVNLGNADTLRLRKGRRRPEPSAAVGPRDPVSRPAQQRTSDSDSSVFCSSSPGQRDKRTSGLSVDTSPSSLSEDVRLSPVASTLSQDSRGSSYRTCRENSHTETAENTFVVPRSPDKLIVTGRTEGNSPKVGIICETRFDDDEEEETVVMSEDVGAETTSDNGEAEAEFIQKPSLAVPNINRRSTVTSSV